MSLPVLDLKCSECRGSGAMQAVEWDTYRRRRLARECELVLAGHPLYDAQAKAEGETPEPDGPEEVPCGVCGGHQRVPTEDGERLLEFIRRHTLTDLIEPMNAALVDLEEVTDGQH